MPILGCGVFIAKESTFQSFRAPLNPLGPLPGAASVFDRGFSALGPQVLRLAGPSIEYELSQQ